MCRADQKVRTDTKGEGLLSPREEAILGARLDSVKTSQQEEEDREQSSPPPLVCAKSVFGQGKGADRETTVCSPGRRSRLEIKM